MLITKRDAEKLNFNSERRAIESLDDFMKMYMQILHLACEKGWISETNRNLVAKAIFVAIEKASAGKANLKENYIYVVSMRLSTLSNFQCWELLEKITSQEAADSFISETKEWLLARIHENRRIVKEGYKLSLKLRYEPIISEWVSCNQTLKSFGRCLEADSKFNCKLSHNILKLCAYQTMESHQEGLTSLDKLEKYIRALANETSILCKIGGDKIIQSMLMERRRQSKEPIKDPPELARKEKAIKELFIELEEMEKTYSNLLERALASDKAYERALELFEKEHSNLDENEFEEAFDKYWTSCPEYVPYDYDSLYAEYKKKRKVKKQKIESLSRQVDIIKTKMSDMSLMIENSEDVSLKDIVLEYMIDRLAKKGDIAYPNTRIEKIQILYAVEADLKTAVRIFLEDFAEKFNFDAEECKYLEIVGELED